MVKFVEMNGQYCAVDDTSISALGLTVVAEISEEELEKYNGAVHCENGELVLGQDEDMNNVEELRELEKWFEEYDKQVIQYQRSLRLGIEFDKNINELDEQAVVNAARIKELRTKIQEIEIRGG